MRSLPILVTLSAATLALSVLGCSSSRRSTTVVVTDRPVVVATKSGPPPHAPAHGYRAKHRGVDMVYDSGIGVYTVVGHRGCYYRSDRFFRQQGSTWQVSASIRGPWKTTSRSAVPNGLVAMNEKSEKSQKGKSKNKH
ncbi:MAG TPA: hypothetical protein VFP10_14045 [Candidatus Eisenbacteria bacterium]|nr:hypothetical protein [Candidatus Eisenbacteria bacterium]